MTKIFVEVQVQYEGSLPHIFSPGRKAIHSIEDVVNKGYELMQVQSGQTSKESDTSDDIEKPEFDDLVMELL